MASTADIYNAMKNEAKEHVWQSITPKDVIIGPITRGQLAFPCLGITSINSDAGPETLVAADNTEHFFWTIGDILNLGSTQEQHLALIQWKDEARALMRKAIDGFWGLNDSVHNTKLLGWFGAFSEWDDAGNTLLTSITIRQEVEYREQLS